MSLIFKHPYRKFWYLFKSKVMVLACVFLSSMFANSQVPPPPPCLANGNNGFGGAVGEGVFSTPLYSTNPIAFNMFINPNSGDMNDILVLYIDTGAPGRSTIDNTIEDNGDAYRIAISNSDFFGYGSHISFPPDFEATYAVAVDSNFGALYAIPNSGSIGTNDLNLVTTVNSTLTSPTQPNYQFSFNWEDIGLIEGDEFQFVGLYVRFDGYSSDEGYGDGIIPGTSGSDPITFTDSRIIPGCALTLSADATDVIDGFNAYYLNNQLVIKGLNKVVTLQVYDIHGRKTFSKQLMVSDEVPINLELKKYSLQFIAIETANKRKVLKVVPN